MNKSERKYGSIPEWAKTGVIDVKNYHFRAEAHAARKSQERGGVHPTISLDSSDFQLWRRYFDVHLGGRPCVFRMLVDKAISEMTLPEQVPQWFDPSFDPSPVPIPFGPR